MDISNLQRIIDNEIKKRAKGEIITIQISKVVEETDSNNCLDVDVTSSDGKKRMFTIITRNFINQLFNQTINIGDSDTSFYVVGGPLIIAKEISGELVVQGILKYISIEEKRKW